MTLLIRSVPLARVLAVLVVGTALVGCSSSGTPSYLAVRTDPASTAAPATVEIAPTVRLLSLDGQPVDELPVVGVRDMRRDKGTHDRKILLSPGRYTLTAGVGPFFRGNSSTSGGGGAAVPMAPAGGGTHLTVGFGGGGRRTTSSTFRYPGSDVDQRIEFEVKEGGSYTVRIAGDTAEGSPGWRVEVFDRSGRQVASRVLETLPSEHEGEPLRRYFTLRDGAALP